MRSVRQWAHETAGGLPRQFWYLWTGTLINKLGQFVFVFLAIYLHQVLGFSAAFTGLVLGSAGLGSAIGSTIGGVLADRWGRRRTMLLGQYSGGVTMIATGFLHQPLLIMTGVFFLGFTTDMARPAIQAMVADLVPGKDRLRAFSLNYWAINLGFSFAAIAAGFAAKVDYLLLFLVDGGTTLFVATFIVRRLAETRPQAAVRAAGAPAAGAVRVILRDRIFLVFALLNICTAIVFMQHISMLPIAMDNDGLSASTYGTVIALNGVLIVFGQLFIPKLLKGRSGSHMLAAAAIVMGFGFGLTAFTHTPLLYAFTVLVWTLGEMLNAPSNATMIAELSPLDMRGRYQGTFTLSWSVAAFTAPILGGWVHETFGNEALWLGCFVLGAAVAAVQIVSGPARERRAGELRSSATVSLAAPAAEAAGEVGQPTPAAA
jgi:MFS family permease